MRVSLWWAVVLGLILVIAVALALRQSAINQPPQTAVLPTANPALRPTATPRPSAPLGLSQPTPAVPLAAAPERLTALEAKVKGNPSDIESLKELGGLYYQMRQYPQAADKFAAVLAVQPDNARVRTDLGSSFLYQGMLAQAKREYLQAIAADPTLPDPHFNLAVALFHDAPPNIPQALAEWREVIRLAPDSDLARTAQDYIRSYETLQASPTKPPR